MGKKVKERIIPEAEYLARLEQGVPVGNCWVDMGNGQMAYALQEVVVVGVTFNKYGDKFYDAHTVNFCVADNTRMDTRQRDAQIHAFNSAMEMDRKKKALVTKVKDIVNKYYDNQIKQFPDRETLLIFSKLRFNRETITKDRFYHYDFPQELMSGVDGEIIKELITVSGGNFTDENPDYKTYLSSYEPSWSEKWSESDNILMKTSYSIFNDVYVVLQVFTDEYFGTVKRTNELTGGRAYRNMDGSTNYSPIDNLIDILPLVISTGTSSIAKELPKGLLHANKLNAAQFSKIMSRVFLSKSSLYKPTIRTWLQKCSNIFVIGTWNSQISRGMILFRVKSLHPKKDLYLEEKKSNDQ
jgi:hypothetical protein